MRPCVNTLKTLLLVAGVCSSVGVNSSAQCATTSGKTVKCAQAGHPGGQCSILKTIDGGGTSECCDSCSGYPGCDFWVFQEQLNQCYLKTGDRSYVVSVADHAFGYIVAPSPPPPPPPQAPCVGSRLSGQAIKCKAPGGPGGACTIIQTLPSTSADQCCSWCAGNPKCEFWVLDVGDGACNLKAGDNTFIIENSTHTSGLKKPLPPSTWPTFANQPSLQSSPWGTYFMNLYGELPSQYPLDLRTFWCFYLDKMKLAVSIPPSEGQCPTSKVAPEGQRYDENNAYSSKDLTWLWHPLSSSPFSGYSSNSIVEVSHQKDPFGDEHHGMWFLYAKGSGVFLDVGNTKIFPEHQDAMQFFEATGNEDMCQKAAAKGYDSIQFIKHVDGVNYPCAAQIGVTWMNIEIVATKLIGTYSCGQAQGTASALRAGWNGDKACSCDPSNPNTNCVFSLGLADAFV